MNEASELLAKQYFNMRDRTLNVHDGEKWVVIARDVDVDTYLAIIAEQAEADDLANS